MNLKKLKRRSRSGISEVVGAMLLLIVGIIAVTSFAYYLAGAQKQAQDLNSFRQNVTNDKLRIAHMQIFPNDPLTQFQFNTSLPPSPAYTVSAPLSTTTVSDDNPADSYGPGAYDGWIITFSSNNTYSGTVISNTAGIGASPAGTGLFTFSPALSTTITSGTFTLTEPPILFYITENPTNTSEVTVQNGTDRLTQFPWSPYINNVALWDSSPASSTGPPTGHYSDINTRSYSNVPCLENSTANTDYSAWSIVFGSTTCSSPGDFAISLACAGCNSFAFAAIDYFNLDVMNYNVQQSGLVDIEVNDSWVSNFFANGQSWGGSSLPLPFLQEQTQPVQVFVNSLKIFADEPLKITLQSTAGNFFTTNYEPPSALITQTDFQQESVSGGVSTIYDVQVFSGLSSLDPDANASIALYMWTVSQTGVPALCPTLTCTSPPVSGSGFELQWTPTGTYQCIDPQEPYTVTLTVQDTNGFSSTGNLTFQGDSQAYYNPSGTCSP